MRVVEASAVVPLSPEEAWDLLIGDQMHRLVEMPEISVVAVEDFQVRPDGTARYVVANKAGHQDLAYGRLHGLRASAPVGQPGPEQPLRRHFTAPTNPQAGVHGCTGAGRSKPRTRLQDCCCL